MCGTLQSNAVWDALLSTDASVTLPLGHLACFVQVITEPGTEEALHSQWEGKLVFARKTESIFKAITYYISNEEARLARQKLTWEFAWRTYSLQPYLKDLL